MHNGDVWVSSRIRFQGRICDEVGDKIAHVELSHSSTLPHQLLHLWRLSHNHREEREVDYTTTSYTVHCAECYEHQNKSLSIHTSAGSCTFFSAR